MAADFTDAELSSEQWKPIPGYPDYEASDLGRIRGWRATNGAPRKTPRVLKMCSTEKGYLRARILSSDGARRWVRAHVLVMLAWVGPCPPGMEVRHHPDDTRSNNRLSNLLFGTRSMNQRDRSRAYHGRVLALRAEGRTYPSIAAELGLGVNTVWKIVNVYTQEAA